MTEPRDTRLGLVAQEGNAVPLLGVEVRAEVVAGHARATVRQRYRSDEPKPIEAIYTFPLPTRAILTGFSMTASGRRLDGEVEGREEAFGRYDDAITAGHGAALLEQERPNVFTANVGNLLPGEETVIEIEYVEPVIVDEGAVRWSVPTLVAPRYIPGTEIGDRTAHGTAHPTSRVPDADRISPPIADVGYGLALDLVFDLGVPLDVASPSHALVVRDEGGKTRVTFTQREVPLDRDVVVVAQSRAASSATAPIASVVAHRKAGGVGTMALTVVPDLGAVSKAMQSEIVFVLDRSGSMGGTSMAEARSALRLCLRQLREGDRFGIIAFDDTIERFAPVMVPFTQATLQKADAWLAQVDARGGTELLEPMLEAAKLAPDGVIVVLTDGQVGNEDEIATALMGARKTGRVYSFGIGTNVSDALLVALADRTGGAVEMIHPGERLDDKVVAQFARATARRVVDLSIKHRGVDIGELAPAEPIAMIDGEPFCLFGTYESAAIGAVEIRGRLDGENFFLEVPVDLPAESDRPTVEKLWAQARIRDLEKSALSGRRADRMRERIIELAKEHRVSSRFTSFIVVEKRTGERRATTQAATRVVPVSAPAGWAKGQRRSLATFAGGLRARAATLGGIAPPPPPMAAPVSPIAAAGRAGVSPRAMSFGSGGPPPPPAPEIAMAPAAPKMETRKLGQSVPSVAREREEESDPVRAILSSQAASGLWEGSDVVDSTVAALASLLQLGITTSHPMFGAQIKKAVEALIDRLAKAPPSDGRLLERALGVAWLVATGRRTRSAVESVLAEASKQRPDLASLAGSLGDEASVRALVDRLG